MKVLICKAKVFYIDYAAIKRHYKARRISGVPLSLRGEPQTKADGNLFLDQLTGAIYLYRKR